MTYGHLTFFNVIVGAYIWDRRLPSAYILPKHSRDWSKARPIVSYTQTVCAPLSQTVASAIYCLLQVVFPELTALSDVLPLLRHIWRILQHYDPTDDLVLFQQDIAGFFNFVTHPRMISTVEFLITRYAALQGLDLRDDPILSVAQHQQERLQRIFRGRWRKTSRSYHPIHLRDLPALVSHLLDSSYFTVGLTVFRQCQGASMGSPLAPPCAALSPFSVNTAFYAPFPLPRGATPLDWPFGHATSTTSFSLDLHTCYILTPSRPSLNLSFTADHWRWSMSRMRPFSVLFSPLLNAQSPFDNHLTSH